MPSVINPPQREATFAGSFSVSGDLHVGDDLAVTGEIGSPLTAGSGFSGTGTIHLSRVSRFGNLAVTEVFVDLTGLDSSAAGDVIGKAATANCHFGQIDAAVHGTIQGGLVTCLEAPAGGEPDIDFYTAPEATLTEDSAISASTGEAALLEAAADWTINTQKALTGMPAAGQYLYLVASGGGDNASYTGGKFLLQLYGQIG